MNQNETHRHASSRKKFAVGAIIIQTVILVMYSLYVRVDRSVDDAFNSVNYPMFQDVNVMMLIGFGFLMTFIKRHSWSALSYTFLINVIGVQLYILMSGFWTRVFTNFDERTILVNEKTFTGASYSVASILIAFGAVLGRVGPLELLILSTFGVFGYTLNEYIVYELLHVRDVGGSTAIHTFGAYLGIGVSIILSLKHKVQRNVEGGYINSTFAMIGTLFLWMYWPSFNAGFFPENAVQRSLIISNTILSLTGSCLSTFIISSLLRNKYSMDDILNATLAGGVMIGAPAGIVVNPGIALFIGILAGIISTLCFIYLGELLKQKQILSDTCGVHNLHGIPGVLGGIISGCVIGGYSNGSAKDDFEQYISFKHDDRTDVVQGGFQVAGTFVSLGIGLLLGLAIGGLMLLVYNFKNEDLFEDSMYFDVPEQQSFIQKKYTQEEQRIQSHQHINAEQPLSIKLN